MACILCIIALASTGCKLALKASPHTFLLMVFMFRKCILVFPAGCAFYLALLVFVLVLVLPATLAVLGLPRANVVRNPGPLIRPCDRCRTFKLFFS